MSANDRIELTRQEAETLAYAYSKYDILLTALSVWPERDVFVLWGSVSAVRHDLENAEIYTEEE